MTLKNAEWSEHMSDDTWFAIMCAKWHLNVDYSTELGMLRFTQACDAGIIFC